MTTAQKPWFKISEPSKTKDVVEYSTDFSLFSENQICIVRTGKKYSFCSRLEAKTFAVKYSYIQDGTINGSELSATCHQIHNEILNGQHGVGKLVD